MTVILAQLQTGRSIHCSDSLLTRKTDGRRERVEGSGMAKIISCPKFHGAISWWGSVGTDTWNAKNWLEEVISRLDVREKMSVDNFADSLADELTYLLKESHLEKQRGIGLHFTSLEKIDGNLIPELFLITNYNGMEYQTSHRFVSQRQTFHTISDNRDSDVDLHKRPSYRQKVFETLRHAPLIYSNGQPQLFAQLMPEIRFSALNYSQKKQKFWRDFPYKICKKIVELHKEKVEYDQLLAYGPFWEITVSLSSIRKRQRF